tara:strand:+ start:2127 stop:3173 length:1047 start_codon:yes stop_codon:yes gene_type:complete
MTSKITIGLIFGGTSGEHGVSIISAYNIQSSLNREKYNVLMIGIDKDGSWYLGDSVNFFEKINDVDNVSFKKNYPSILPQKNFLNNSEFENALKNVDVFFPITHGRHGEDGAMQGLLEMTGKPYVGSDVFGSAICMDKEVTKRLLLFHGIPVARYVLVRDPEEFSFESIDKEIGIPFFVKPCREGSSIGVSKVNSKDEYRKALHNAFNSDRKVLIEESIVGREIECSVLGNNSPEAAKVLGEIIPHSEFYSYEAKYVEKDGADLIIPAKIEPEVCIKIRKAAVDAFLIAECRGMARVDFFLCKDNTFILNEINTLPGFTKISMFPKLWESSGLQYSDLLDRLIDLAIE